jgi:hypothetical protein
MKEYTYNENHDEEQRAVVKLEIGGEEWLVDYDIWKEAEAEGRTFPVIYADKLVLVDRETFEEFKKLDKWLDDRRLD